MADIFHSRRYLHPHGGHADLWALVRAVVGGMLAIVLLAALAAGLAGGAVYALVRVVTALVE
jgi:hypothetical protein